MAYMGPAFNTFDVNFNFDDLVLDPNDIANNGDLLQYDGSQWLTVSNLTIPGDLIVNGTTTTVNSTTVTIDDPIFTLGGDVAPTVTDALDRGIEFRWHDGVNAKTGFFGFDNGTGSFTFIPDATNTNEVFSGTPGSVNFYDANFSGNTAIKIPVGGTADRPTALQGQLRYNTDLNQFEGYDGSNWAGLGGIIDADQDTYIDAEQTADDDTLRFYTGGVERMTIDGNGNINFNGGLELGLQATQTGEVTTTATTQIALDSWSITAYRTAKYMLQAIDTVSSEYHVSELMVIHDGTTAYATEYGTIHTGANPLASYDVDVNSNAVRLLATPASTNNTNFKFSRNALTPEPTFALASSSGSINEGDSVTFTLTTTQVSNGTLVPYTVTGIQSADLSSGSLTGNFTINNNTATSSFTLSADATTEGSETLTLTLDNGQASSAVTIGDTSLDPTYTLSADNTTINEGASVVITLTTTNVPDATNVAYTVTGVDADDLSAGSLTGNFTISSNTATATFTLAEDTTTEGDETLTLTLDNGNGNIAITITDSSTTISSGALSDGWVRTSSPVQGPLQSSTPIPRLPAVSVGDSGTIFAGGSDVSGNKTTYAIAYDTDGGLEWARRAGGNNSPYQDEYQDVATTGNDAIMVGNGYGHATYGPGLITKFLADGTTSWQKILYDTANTSGSPNDDWWDTRGVAVGSDGSIYVCGQTRIGGLSYSENGLFVTKLASDGTHTWTRILEGGTGAEQQGGYKIAIDSNDNVFVCGTAHEDVSGNGYVSAFVAKLTSAGSMQWYRIYNDDGDSLGRHSEYATQIKVNSSDEIIISGFTNTDYAGQNYPFVAKLANSDGNIIWQRRSNHTDPGQGIALDNSDNIYQVCNNYQLNIWDDSGSLIGEWEFTSGNGSFYTRGITKDHNGNMIIVGHSVINSTSGAIVIKLPATISAGTWGDLTISATSNGDTAGALILDNHTSISESTPSNITTSDANSNLTQAPVTVTGGISENVTGGSSGSGVAWGGERGIVAGGFDSNSNWINNIDYFDITTPGNATDFGDLTVARYAGAAMSSGTRIVFAAGTGTGGSPGAYKNTIDYITSATTGNATDFGDMDNGYGSGVGGTSDSTRGVTAGGFRYDGFSQYNNMDYITIATTSNSTTFGNLVYNQNSKRAMGTDGTIGVITSGGHTNATGGQTNEIEYITIQTAGNATLSSNTLSDSWNNVQNLPGDSTHVLLAGGRSANGAYPNGWTDKVEQITVATQATSANFGSLNVYGGMAAAGGDGTYAFFAGRESSSNVNDFPGQHINGRHNTIERMTIATGGTATDHGDLTNYVEGAMGSSGGAS